MNLNFYRGMSVAVVALALAACGDNKTNTPGAGVDASATAGTSVSSSESSARERHLSVENSSAAKVSMPAWGLFVDAMNEMSTEIQDTIFNEAGDMFVPNECPYGLGKFVNQPVSINEAEDSILFTSCGKALKLVTQIIPVSEPVNGWPKDNPVRLKSCLGGMGCNGKTPDEIRASYMDFVRSSVYLSEKTNLIASEILKNVAANSLRDPEEAKLKIKEATADFIKSGRLDVVEDNLNADLESLCSKEFVAIANGSEKHPVEFRCDGAIYGGDAQGWHIVKNGIDWFGGGVIMGKKIELALDSAISAGMSKNIGVGSEQRDEAGSAAGSNTGVR